MVLCNQLLDRPTFVSPVVPQLSSRPGKKVAALRLTLVVTSSVLVVTAASGVFVKTKIYISVFCCDC